METGDPSIDSLDQKFPKTSLRVEVEETSRRRRRLMAMTNSSRHKEVRELVFMM
jgi:hypothetical protein